MNRRRFPLWPFALLLLVAAGVAAFLWFRPGQQSWFSDSTAVRPWSSMSRLLAPTNLPPFQPNPDFLTSLSVSTNAPNQLQLQLTSRAMPSGAGLRWQVVQADERLHADLGIGDASVEIAYLATGWGKPTNNPAQSQPADFRVPGRFFHADLSPFQPADFKRFNLRKWDRNLSFRQGTPTLALALRFANLEGWTLLGLRAFDARTHAPLQTSGYSHGTHEFGYHLETRLALWHDTPVDVVLDLALGPPETFEFLAKQGAYQAFPGGAVSLLALMNGNERSWSSSSNGRTETITVRFDPSDDKPQSSLIFFCQPAAHPMPFVLELLDANGKVVPDGGVGSSGRMMIKSASTALTNIARVRLRYFPNHRRLVFHLPRLPGLPAANAAVKNLFKVRVPFARFRTEYQMREWLERLIQVQLQPTRSPTVPPGTFPVEFTDATVGEVFEFYLGLFPPGTVPRLNSEDWTLRLGRSATYELVSRIGQWLQGKFR